MSDAAKEVQRLQTLVDYDALRQSPRQLTVEETENSLDLNMWQAVLIDNLSAERDALRSQVAVLREALEYALLLKHTKYADATIRKAVGTLADTEAAARAYEREVTNRVLEEQLGLLNKAYDAHDNARDFYMAARENLIRAMVTP